MSRKLTWLIRGVLTLALLLAFASLACDVSERRMGFVATVAQIMIPTGITILVFIGLALFWKPLGKKCTSESSSRHNVSRFHAQGAAAPHRDLAAHLCLLRIETRHLT